MFWGGLREEAAESGGTARLQPTPPPAGTPFPQESVNRLHAQMHAFVSESQRAAELEEKRRYRFLAEKHLLLSNTFLQFFGRVSCGWGTATAAEPLGLCAGGGGAGGGAGCVQEFLSFPPLPSSMVNIQFIYLLSIFLCLFISAFICIIRYSLRTRDFVYSHVHSLTCALIRSRVNRLLCSFLLASTRRSEIHRVAGLLSYCLFIFSRNLHPLGACFSVCWTGQVSPRLAVFLAGLLSVLRAWWCGAVGCQTCSAGGATWVPTAPGTQSTACTSASSKVHTPSPLPLLLALCY